MLPSTVFIKKSNTHFYKVSVRNDVRRPGQREGKKVKHHKRISKDTYLKHKRSQALQVGSGQAMSLCLNRNKHNNVKTIDNIIKIVEKKFGKKYAEHSKKYYDKLLKEDKAGGLVENLQIQIDKECLKNIHGNLSGSSWYIPLFNENKTRNTIRC